MGVSKHSANSRLFSANRTASFSVQDFTMRTAVDWNALLLATLCLAFHTSTDGAVHRGPHLSILEYLIAKLAHFHFFRSDVGDTFLAAVVLVFIAFSRKQAPLPTYHC